MHLRGSDFVPAHLTSTYQHPHRSTCRMKNRGREKVIGMQQNVLNASHEKKKKHQHSLFGLWKWRDKELQVHQNGKRSAQFEGRTVTLSHKKQRDTISKANGRDCPGLHVCMKQKKMSQAFVGTSLHTNTQTTKPWYECQDPEAWESCANSHPVSKPLRHQSSEQVF